MMAVHSWRWWIGRCVAVAVLVGAAALARTIPGGAETDRTPAPTASTASTTSSAGTGRPRPAPVPARSKTFVSASGDDDAAGSSNAPLRTITAALTRTPSRGTVVVRSGTYHESVVMSGRTDRTLTAAPGARVRLDGSEPVLGWQRTGNTWTATGWEARFDASPTFTAGAPDGAAEPFRFVNPEHPMAANPDQVFVDGVAQQQVGSAAEVGPGTFYADYDRASLVLGSDPSGREVRASDLAKALSIREPGAVIRGFGVRRYATSVPLLAAVTVEAPGATVADLRVADNAASGLFVGAARARLSNLELVRNGLLGLHGNRADRLRVDNVLVAHNNTQLFNPAPSAGGAKITRSRDVVVRDSRFRANAGTGLWFDESVYEITVVGSSITDNALHGLSLEISGRATVVDNVVRGNAGNGIKVNDTDRVRIWNNTITGGDRPVNVVQDQRDLDAGASYRDPSLPLSLRSERVVLRNNIIARPAGGAQCLLCVEDYSHRFSARQLRISADANLYQRGRSGGPRRVVVWSRGAGDPATYPTLRRFRSATGQEERGLLATGAPVLQRNGALSARATAWAKTHAAPTPRWLAALSDVPAGARHWGVWR